MTASCTQGKASQAAIAPVSWSVYGTAGGAGVVSLSALACKEPTAQNNASSRSAGRRRSDGQRLGNARAPLTTEVRVDQPTR